MRQSTLFKVSHYTSEFGGSLLNGKRKTARPISSKNALKIVLRADMKATQEALKTKNRIKNKAKAKAKAKANANAESDCIRIKSLLKYRKEIDMAFAKFAEKFGVKIYEKALVSNHIHFVARFGSRDQYKKFMRALTGTLSKQLKIKWHLRPWSRIVAWGRALKTAISYTLQNHLEAIGAIPYQKRVRRHRSMQHQL